MEKINGGNLLEGMAEVVAKQVEGNALPLLKPIDAAQDQLEVFGSAAAKADADARLVLEELMDARVRMDCDAVYQQNEWLKHDLDSERKRTLVYKEKYEASEERIVELEGEIERQKEEYEEKIRGKDEEICKLKAILDYLKENPQQLTIVLGQYNNQTDKRSQVTVQETTIENDDDGMKTCDAVADKISEEIPIANAIEDIKICRFIVQDKIKDNTTYGKTEEERIDTYNRIIYRESHRPFPQFCKFLKSQNDCGKMSYEVYEQDYQTIYDHFVECYGDLHANYTSFRNACKGVMNGKPTGFYWNPHK